MSVWLQLKDRAGPGLHLMHEMARRFAYYSGRVRFRVVTKGTTTIRELLEVRGRAFQIMRRK